VHCNTGATNVPRNILQILMTEGPSKVLKVHCAYILSLESQSFPAMCQHFTYRQPSNSLIVHLVFKLGPVLLCATGLHMVVPHSSVQASRQGCLRGQMWRGRCSRGARSTMGRG